jgi:hypothetical protein
MGSKKAKHSDEEKTTRHTVPAVIDQTGLFVVARHSYVSGTMTSSFSRVKCEAGSDFAWIRKVMIMRPKRLMLLGEIQR